MHLVSDLHNLAALHFAVLKYPNLIQVWKHKQISIGMPGTHKFRPPVNSASFAEVIEWNMLHAAASPYSPNTSQRRV
jgi:hypothetical protein